MGLQAGFYSRRETGVNDPGKLDRSVILLAPVRTQSALGEMITAWASFATVWASKTALSANRLMAEDSKHNVSMVRYRIRHRLDVNPLNRLVHGDDTYEIVDASELGRRHFLDLICRAFDQTPGASGTVNQSNVLTSFTAYTNAAGNTTIAATGTIYNTAQVTFSGLASTRILILAAGNNPGAVVRVSALFPATLGIDAQIRNLTAGGTLLYELSSDASGASAAFELIWNGNAWTQFKSTYPA